MRHSFLFSVYTGRAVVSAGLLVTGVEDLKTKRAGFADPALDLGHSCWALLRLARV
ncbi:hypothetical protein QQG91_12000 [Marivivens sp. LCG002]|uniref:hypothetical protein n=1 Tax=Marivivens sp. LCG002 TaxID=3051171 RepID=UPI002555AD60|nr:hypothetical protein [Marivivens sp. LCG002]WIV50383.1 hypothetical protein QQG91_12000 [Marivivens sp. LCG002]